MKRFTQQQAGCCYARSNKNWARDPQGIPWHAFHTLGEVPVFGGGALATKSNNLAFKAGCCAPGK